EVGGEAVEVDLGAGEGHGGGQGGGPGAGPAGRGEGGEGRAGRGGGDGLPPLGGGRGGEGAGGAGPPVVRDREGEGGGGPGGARDGRGLGRGDAGKECGDPAQGGVGLAGSGCDLVSDAAQGRRQDGAHSTGADHAHLRPRGARGSARSGTQSSHCFQPFVPV